MSEQIQIGDKIIANQMGRDSFYQKASGVVTSIKNGFVEFRATMVQSKWDDELEPHPGSGCMTFARIENVERVI